MQPFAKTQIRYPLWDINMLGRPVCVCVCAIGLATFVEGAARGRRYVALRGFGAAHSSFLELTSRKWFPSPRGCRAQEIADFHISAGGRRSRLVFESVLGIDTVSSVVHVLFECLNHWLQTRLVASTGLCAFVHGQDQKAESLSATLRNLGC